METEDALCLGSSVNFFPERGQSTAAAKNLCRRCVLQEECLQEALDDGIHHGVYGGASARQRRQIRQMGLTAHEAIERGVVT